MDILLFIVAAGGLVGWFLWTPRRKPPIRRFSFAPLCADEEKPKRRRRDGDEEEQDGNRDDNDGGGGYGHDGGGGD